MLDKTSEIILKCIISKCDGNPEVTVELTPEDFSTRKISYELLNSVCYDLCKSEYINPFAYGYIGSPLGITLTYKGYSYFEYKKIAKREYVKQLALSKLSDIVVSAIVALITALLVA